MKSKNKNEFLLLFKEESLRHLDELNEELLRFEKNPHDLDLLEEMRRKLHSLKGGAHMMGFSKIADFIHRLEDAFIKVKDFELSSMEFDVLFSSFDVIRKLVEDAVSANPVGVDYKELNKRLKDFSGKKRAAGKKVVYKQRKVDLSVFKTDVKNFIHVDVAKVDDLMSLVNELIIQKSRLVKHPQKIQDVFSQIKAIHHDIRLIVENSAFPSSLLQNTESIEMEIRDLRDKISFFLEDLTNQAGRMESLIDQLENTSLKMRMLPLSIIFNKMQRLVRDLAKEKNKEVRLVFSGENTELDKKIIEMIQDPIMHLIRNCVDHGIEPPRQRKKSGKLAEGVIILNAYQKGNRIIIEVEDDGAGIDRQEVLAAAVRQNLIGSDEAKQLDDNAAYELLFRSGFSTRREVSSVSGRGVGLDVVRDSLSRLQGNITVTSQAGLRTKFVLDVPVTIAATSVLLVSEAGRLYAVPLSEVKETINLGSAMGEGGTVSFMNENVPVLSLSKLLDLPEVMPAEPRAVLVVQFMNRFVGVSVDAVEGQEHVVTKNLGMYLGKVKNFAGAAILSDTRLALIIDFSEILNLNWRNFVVK